MPQAVQAAILAVALTGGGDGHSSWSLGLAHEDLDAVAVGDRPWVRAGASSLSNNFGTQPFSSFLRHPTQGSVPPGGCTGAHFAIVGTGPSSRCTYDFNALADSEPGTADDGGPRRQPELSEVAEYHPEQEPASNDLVLLDDDDLPLPLPRQLDPTMQRTARLASLDPNDGIEL